MLIVFFLKKQIESGKPIKKEDGNLGRLFYEFLYFYGIQFDPSKHVVNVSDLQSQKKLYEQSSYVSFLLYNAKSSLKAIWSL